MSDHIYSISVKAVYMANSYWKDTPCSRLNKAVTGVFNTLLDSHAHSNKLNYMFQTSMSLCARVCFIYWTDAFLCLERHSCMRSALLRICHFIHTDLLVLQCICSCLAHSRCSVRNSKVKTAGKVGRVHFFCNTVQVCMERRCSSEKTWAGQCRVETDSQTMNISAGVKGVT